MTNLTNEPQTRKIDARLIWLLILAIASMAIIVWLPNALAPKPVLQIDTGAASVSVGKDGISVRTNDADE